MTTEIVPVTGTADDTAAVQAAINTGFPVRLPVGPCSISSLDLTNRSFPTLEGSGYGTQIIPLMSGVNVLDITGSNGATLRNFRIYGNNPLIVPSNGILNAQMAGSEHSDTMLIDRVRVDGYFSLAAWFNLQVQSSAMRDSQLYNYQSGALTAIITGNNFFGATSAYQTINNANNCIPSDWTLSQIEIHNMGGGNALWMGGGDSIRFYGGNVSSNNGKSPVDWNAVTVNEATAYPKNCLFDSTTFYTDDGSTPSCAINDHTGGHLPTLRNNTCAFPLT